MTRGMKVRRRRQQVKLIMILVIGVFVLAILSGFIFKSQSIKGSELEFDKTYKEVVVYYGDTVWDIAKNNYDEDYYNIEDYVDEILAINSMSNTYLKAGHVIMVPVVIR